MLVKLNLNLTHRNAYIWLLMTDIGKYSVSLTIEFEYRGISSKYIKNGKTFCDR